MTGEGSEREPGWRRSRPYGTTSGLLAVSAAASPLLAQWGLEVDAPQRSAVLAAVALTCASLLIASWTIPRSPRHGRVFATAGMVGMMGLSVPTLWGRPFLTLTASLAALAAFSLLWDLGGGLGQRLRRRRPVLQSAARGAALGALSLFGGSIFMARAPTTIELTCVASALLAAGVLGTVWSILERRIHPVRAAAHGVAVSVAGLLIASAQAPSDRLLEALALLGATTALSPPSPREGGLEGTPWWEPLLGHPERLFTGTFAALCAAGTLVLCLPESAGDGVRIAVLDAAFTAVSAVCVTGLIVLDTPHDLSTFGQAAILALIQLGGLGIMTFSTAALRVLDRRMSLRYEGAIARLISPQDRGQLFGAAQRILWVTAVAELVGSIVLTLRFASHGEPLVGAAWRGVFTAVSAFCNAGFALQSDSLVPYQTDPWILHTVAALIIAGGLAPAAVVALPTLARRRVRPRSAQVHLSLAAAGFLLLAGFVLFLAFEWDSSLAGLSVLDRIHNAWFQSATLRTAGFNSVDLGAVRPATVSLMLVWMFIGGSPGGTAGGIKTTTAALLVMGVVATVRGHADVSVFGRRVSQRTLQRATVTATLGAATVLAGVLALQLTQDLEATEVIFEVVSASATVGLSLGATARLDGIGECIIIACMFSGRVGPLTLLMFLSRRHATRVLERPEEDIDVG